MTVPPRSENSPGGAAPFLGAALRYAALGYPIRPQEVAAPIGVSFSQARGVMRGELLVIPLPGSGGGERAQRRCRRKSLRAWVGECGEADAGQSRQDQR